MRLVFQFLKQSGVSIEGLHFISPTSTSNLEDSVTLRTVRDVSFHLAILRDFGISQAGVELHLKKLLSKLSTSQSSSKKKDNGRKGRREVNLDTLVEASIGVCFGRGRITKPKCILSVEEILDLLFHLRRFSVEKAENEFEWSTIEKSVQPLRSNNNESGVSLSFEFDTSDQRIKEFSNDIASELRQLLSETGETLSRLEGQLKTKIKKIRETNASPPEPI